MRITDAIEQVERALDAGDLPLARRYLSKLREGFVCSRCHRPVDVRVELVGAHDYYTGVRHDGCV